jgi:hypothetical protein
MMIAVLPDEVHEKRPEGAKADQIGPYLTKKWLSSAPAPESAACRGT